MPILERAVPAPSGEHTIAAIETILGVLHGTAETDDTVTEVADTEHHDAVADGAPVLVTQAVGSHGHGKIRLHGR